MRERTLVQVLVACTLLVKQGFNPQEALKLMAGNCLRVFTKAVADRKAA
jgi:hypothetical protein